MRVTYFNKNISINLVSKSVMYKVIGKEKKEKENIVSGVKNKFISSTLEFEGNKINSFDN
jgi:hypothetical protein